MAKQAGRHKECVAFGKRIVEFRTELSMNQDALAHKAKIHQTYLSGIENGRRNPTLTMIYKLAKALKVEASELV
jgi:transcriptional regulator with XRE-family HTH domain